MVDGHPEAYAPLRSATLMRVSALVLRMLSPLVPWPQRADWLEEWHSEVWHHVAELERGGTRDLPKALDISRRLRGAFVHAFTLRRNDWRPDMIAQDIAYAMRTAGRRPFFTALVVGMLALGIGASTAMFTVVNSVLLQPLPFPRPGRLIAMNGSFSRNVNAAISGPDFLDYRAQNRVLASMAAYQAGNMSVLSGHDRPERIPSWLVSSAFFTTLGVRPHLGRGFLPEEEASPGHDVAILSYRLWQRRFNADAGVIGTTITLDARPTQIVGVAPPMFDAVFSAELWRPFEFNGKVSSVRRFHNMRSIGRLADGQTVASAQSAMDVIARRLEGTYPENATWKLRLQPYREAVVRDSRVGLMLLLGAVSVVLLIACGNVASLLLARATSRQGEIGIRTALGASRGRLVKQLLTESAFLASLGGLGGVAIALALVHMVRLAGAGYVPRLDEVNVDGTVLMFAVSLSLLTGLMFGLAPALHTVRANVAASFASIGRASGGRRDGRVRDLLVVAQVALSLMLLVGAGLLLRSLRELQRVESGFAPDHVFTAQIFLPEERYGSLALQRYAWNAVLDRLRHTPGVLSASATTMLPLAGGGDTYYWRADQPPANSSERNNGMVNVVADDYFDTMRIPVLKGRVFDASERAGGRNKVLISRRIADHVFEGVDPIGKVLVVDFGKPEELEVIGVVGDVRAFGPSRRPPPTLYFSINQVGGFGAEFFNVVARTTSEPLNLTHPAEQALAALDRDVPLAQPRTMQELVDESTARERLAARLLAAFAVTALALAVVGLYGVLSFVVAQRSRELGVRVALGARPPQLFAMVIRRGATIVVAGLVVGVGVAYWASRFMDTLLFQTNASDPAVFAGVMATMLVTGLLACVVPAHRAMRVDPLVALRSE